MRTFKSPWKCQPRKSRILAIPNAPIFSPEFLGTLLDIANAYRNYTIMALDKSNLFPAHTVALAEFAEGLGHPARISIVTELMKHPDGLCCGELVERMPLAQATVSQHIKVLQRIDLLEATSQHTRMIYRLRQDKLKDFCKAFQQTLGTQDCGNKSPSALIEAASVVML